MPTAQAGKDLPVKTRVAVLFHRFGPYHHARLNAAGLVMPVWGLEACAAEDIYAWTKVEGAAAFTRVTLTDRDTGDAEWKRQVQNKVWQALDEIKPQVVVVNGWVFPDALGALKWCVARRIPAVVMSESTEWDHTRTFWKEWVKGRLVKICAAGLVGGNAHVDYLAQLGLTRDRIFLGYDIVDNLYFQSEAKKIRSTATEVRQQFKLPEKYFLASARFIEKKNLFGLIKAYAKYRQQAAQKKVWDLVLLGDGPLKPALQQLISELGIGTCVHLPGFKQYAELPAYFGLAGVFIHASTTEQWGLVVNEAMASGLPILVSDRCGCAADLVLPGENGFQFNPANIDEITQLMVKISAEDFPLPAFSAASERIISAWGPQRFAKGLCDAVAVALKTPHPNAGFIDRMLLRLLGSR